MNFTNHDNGQKLKFSYKNDVIITNATRDPEKIKNFKGDKILGTTQLFSSSTHQLASSKAISIVLNDYLHIRQLKCNQVPVSIFP